MCAMKGALVAPGSPGTRGAPGPRRARRHPRTWLASRTWSTIAGPALTRSSALHIQFICALRYRQIAGSSSPGQTAPEKHRSALAGVPERAPPPLGGGFNPGHGKRLAASTGTRAVVDVRNERGACHARRAWFTNVHQARVADSSHIGAPVAPATLGAPGARGTSVHLACPTRPAYLAPPASLSRPVRNRAPRRRYATNP